LLGREALRWDVPLHDSVDAQLNTKEVRVAAGAHADEVFGLLHPLGMRLDVGVVDEHFDAQATRPSVGGAEVVGDLRRIRDDARVESRLRRATGLGATGLGAPGLGTAGA